MNELWAPFVRLAQASRHLGLQDVLLRIATETDVKNLTPHCWKERWEPVVADHRADLIQRLVARGAPEA